MCQNCLELVECVLKGLSPARRMDWTKENIPRTFELLGTEEAQRNETSRPVTSRNGDLRRSARVSFEDIRFRGGWMASAKYGHSHEPTNS